MAKAFAGKEIVKALLKKGFRAAQGDHTFLFLYVNDKKTAIRTKVSHGKKTYADDLLGCVTRQLKVTSGECADLVECTLSGEEYVELLKERGHLGAAPAAATAVAR